MKNTMNLLLYTDLILLRAKARFQKRTTNPGLKPGVAE
jgi:hypothetical protein